MVPYPELARRILTTWSRKRLADLQKLAAEVSEYGAAQRYREAPEETLAARFAEARKRAQVEASAPTMDAGRNRYLEVSLLAKIREAARRSVGMEPFPCQVTGALALNRGLIVQMETGEGKTLSAAMSAICNAYAGKRTVIVTANGYLARRDFEWMGPLYRQCNVRVAGVGETDDVHTKYLHYDHDVVYVANSTMIFDYLKSRSAISAWEDLPLSREAAIIDEIDNVLIDQADQSYTITNSQGFRKEPFHKSELLVSEFRPGKEIEIYLPSQRVDFTEEGRAKVKLLAGTLGCHPVEALFYLQVALRARYCFHRDRDYLVDETGVVIIDSVSGRPSPGRRWGFGLQQAIEAKEHVELTEPGKSTQSADVSSIYRNLFYQFSGLSGSAVHNALELMLGYRKELIVIPPNVPCIRVDSSDVVYRTKPERDKRAAQEAVATASQGRPVLIGVASIEEAYRAASAVGEAGGVPELLTAKNVDQEARIISQAGTSGRITIADRLAGRGVDIKLDEQARKSGGLHVIALGRSTDRRLDDQLRGRSGRQGDPGSSQFIMSLQDDLMQFFGGPKMQNIMLRLGMEEDVPVESRMIHRQIQRAQYAAIVARYRQRQSASYLGTAVFNAQRDLFQFRQRVLQAYKLDTLWAELLARIETRFRAEPELIAAAVSSWELELPEDLTFMISKSPGGAAEGVIKFLRAACERALEGCGEAEWNARVKFVILRAVDSSWERFLEEVRRGSDGLTMYSASQTAFERLSSLGRVLRAGRERAWTRADQEAVQFLLNRGRGPFPAVQSMWDAKQLLSPGDVERPLLEKDQREIEGYCWRLAFEPSDGAKPVLASYAHGYLDFLLTNDGKVKRLPQSLEVMKDFQRFLERRSGDDTFPAACHDFLARAPVHRSFGARFLELLQGLRRRRLERAELWGFGEHLHLQGVTRLDASQVVGWKEVAVTSREILRRIALPVLWVRLGYILAFVGIFRNVSSLRFGETPALATAISGRLGPSGVLSTAIDKLLLGGALASGGLGMLGLIPALLAAWAITTATRRRAQIEHWIPSLPVTVLLLAMFTPWRQVAASGEWLAWWATLVAVLGATMLIIMLAAIASVVEVLDPVMLTILVNSWFILAALAVPGPRPTEVLLRLAGFAAILGAYWLASRTAQAKVEVERAEVDLEESTEVEVGKDELGIDIGSDGSQYWNALLAAGLADTLARLGGTPPIPRASIALAAYLFSLLVLQQWRIRTEFGTESVLDFLDSHNSRLPEASGGGAELSAKLGNGVRKLFGFDVAMCGAIAAFAYAAKLVPIALLPYFVGAAMLWGILTNRLLRQMRSALDGNTLAQAIRVPLLVETASEDKPLWRKAADYVLGLQTNAVGALLVLYGLVEMLQKVYELAVRIAKHWKPGV